MKKTFKLEDLEKLIEFNKEIKHLEQINQTHIYNFLSTAEKDLFEMRKYEKENSREKYIYNANKLLNLYYDFCILNLNLDENSFKYDDPYLLSLIFSMISITSIKDQFIDTINIDENIFELVTGLKSVFKPPVSNNFSVPEINCEIGEVFEICGDLEDYIRESLMIIDFKSNTIPWPGKIIFETDDSDNIKIEDNKIKVCKKGVFSIRCTNGINDIILKINCGNIKEKDIFQFYFNQIRNVIAHGRYNIIDNIQGNFKEYRIPIDSYEYINCDNFREIYLSDINRLNINYYGNNWISFSYLTRFSQNLDYFLQTTSEERIIKDKLNSSEVIQKYENIFLSSSNPFTKFISKISFAKYKREKNNIFNIKNYVENNNINDFKVLLLLSKFYINFIYDYDFRDKNSFDYDKLYFPKLITDKKNYIYNIRTAIMHGRYSYDSEKIKFWNFDKKNILCFDETITLDNMKKIIDQKELFFYENMKYDEKRMNINNDKFQRKI